MPVLKNAKREAFANHMARSPKTQMSQAQCYIAAGYRSEGHGAEVAASRLLNSVEVQLRIAELTAPTARKTRTTVDTLAAQFDAAFEGAIGTAQFGSATAAAAAKAKLLGFMRDRLEVGGPGAFDEAQTPADIVNMLIDDCNGDARAVVALLQGMRAIAEDRVVAEARPVSDGVLSWRAPRDTPYMQRMALKTKHVYGPLIEQKAERKRAEKEARARDTGY